MHPHMLANMPKLTYTHIHARTNAHKQLPSHPSVYIITHTYTHTYTHAHTHTYTHTNTHTHIHIHAHICDWI